jgi:excisionase family DNA binding protein
MPLRGFAVASSTLSQTPPAAPPNRATRRHPVKETQRAYVGIPEAANYLDVAPKTIRALIASGKLPAWRLGNRVLKVKLADLDGVLTPVDGGGGNAT